MATANAFLKAIGAIPVTPLPEEVEEAIADTDKSGLGDILNRLQALEGEVKSLARTDKSGLDEILNRLQALEGQVESLSDKISVLSSPAEASRAAESASPPGFFITGTAHAEHPQREVTHLLGYHLPTPWPSGHQLPRLKILVADDDWATYSQIASTLRENYDLIHAQNVTEAMDKAKDLLPDLVLVDLQMPHVDAYSFLQTLKQDVRTRSMAIILLAATGEFVDKLSHIGSGVDDFITKPIDLDEMKLRIDRIIGRVWRR
jgi:CheY-like chemotaxis protein